MFYVHEKCKNSLAERSATLYQNIRNTGGDQDRIESAGAATVSTSTVATRTEAMNGTEVATATTTAMRPKRDCRKPDI